MAVSFVGFSTVTTTIGNQTHTPHASTATDDLVIFFHYTTPDTGTEAVTPPTGFTPIFNAINTSFGLIAAAWRIRQAGDTTYASTVANHTTGTSGDSMLEWLETYRGHDAATPIGSVTAANTTWASSLNIGPINPPAATSLDVDNMLVVFGGRMENVTSQTTLTTLGLTWEPGPFGSTNTGRDAGSVTQHGLNATAGAVTVTAQTITTAGTAQAGAGRMFIINAAAAPPPVTLPIVSMAPPFN